MAQAQLEAETKTPSQGSDKDKGNGNGGGGGITVVNKEGDDDAGDGNGGGGIGGGVVSGGAGGTTTVEPPQLCRFHASAKLDAMRLGRDASKIAEEIVQHLTSIIGAEVEVTLEIQAHIPDGASPDLVRTINENCRTLKFADHG